MHAFEEHRLGIDDDEVDIDTAEEQHSAACLMTQQAGRSIDIISRELDPTVYNLPGYAEILKNMLLANRRARVRIIVFESQLIARRGHLLLELGGNLPSFIEFRTPGREYQQFNESLFVADATGFIYRTSATRYEGNLNFNDKRKSKTFMDVFEEMWARSAPDSNLRKLSL